MIKQIFLDSVAVIILNDLPMHIIIYVNSISSFNL